MEVGEYHFQRALASLNRYFLFFSLSPDWSSVSFESSLAADAFKAATVPTNEAKALRLWAQAEIHLGRHKQAGEILERLGDLLVLHKKATRRNSRNASNSMNNNINNSINSNANITSSDSGNSKSSSIRGIPASAAAAYEEGLQCYSEAVKHYKSAASTDAAVCLLLRIAAAREKEKTPESAEAAAAAYEDALHLRSASGKQQETAEVYKHYICMLVRMGQIRQAISVSLRRANCLFELNKLNGVHKSILSAVLLFLSLEQYTMADRTLSGQEALRSSFLGSPEFAAGAAAVDAFKHGDAAAAAAALESPVFRLLLPPVASLAARMAAEARERCTSSACNPIGEVGIGAEAVDALLAG